ncbi:hypothetical protein G7Y89_g10055 [Cudoniella acicularis]|uniref:Uncharacterized protein n=1 Tax=Cudoniella acicularis TaxID=354080 RepID=A0A8H4RF20_9HELO|nr:hypothetical protein G7Y89_g10055 [Cudoniella acicularis]
MRLATNFINVGMPYISFFLPTNQVFEALQTDWTEGEVIPLKTSFTLEETKRASVELDKLAEDIHWELDHGVYVSRGQWGINIATSQQRPWIQETHKMIEDSDRLLKRRGAARRHITIGFAAQYVDTIQSVAPNSEVHLRAVWHAGVTMAHEIGHAIFVHDFRWDSVDGHEPWVGDQCWAELGYAFMDFVFGGFNPDTIESRRDLASKFEKPLKWRKTRKLRKFEKNRPFYETYWAISNRYMENTLSQQFWDDLGTRGTSAFYMDSRKALLPKNSSSEAIATAVVPDFEVYNGIVDWKSCKYPDRTPQPDTLGQLRAAEVDYARGLSRSEGTHRPLLKGAYVEDDDEEEFGVEDDDESDDFDGYFDDLGRDFNSKSKKRRSRPDPGDDCVWVEEDLRSSGRGDFEPETTLRVEVKFYPTQQDSLPRGKRAPRIDIEPEPRDFKRYKYSKTAEATGDGDDADAVLQDATIPFIERRFTRLEAYRFGCRKRLETYPVLLPHPSWQQGHLNNKDRYDHKVASAIRLYLFRRAEKKFERDNTALLKIKQARADSFDDWTYEDINEFGRLQGVPGSGSDLKNAIRTWLQMDIDEIKDQVLSNQEPKSNGTGGDVSAVEISQWTDMDFHLYFRQHDLPIWGDHAVFVERYYAFKFEQANDFTRPRDDPSPPIKCRFDRDDEETYNFLVNPDTTSLMALKCALFCNGIFPSNSILHIDTNPPTAKLPGDDEPLSWLKENTGPLILTADEQPFPEDIKLRNVREPSPVIWNKSERIATAVKQISRARRKQAQASATAPREEAPKPPPTVANFMENITTKGKALRRILEGSVTGVSSLRNAPADTTPSGFQLLDLMEEYEDRYKGSDLTDLRKEDEATRKKGKGRAVEEAGYEKENIEALQRFEVGNDDDSVSHMSQIVNTLKRRRASERGGSGDRRRNFLSQRIAQYSGGLKGFEVAGGAEASGAGGAGRAGPAW